MKSAEKLLSYSLTPVQEIFDPLFEEKKIRLLIKREDLNHPYVSGNKWWKLKYNLEEAIRQNNKTLLTFGGAYSNHLYATAAAAHELGLESIGVVRGEETLPLNPTLQFVVERGMRVHYVSREGYRNKSEPDFVKRLHEKFGDFYLIPEGGTNELAVKGVAEFAQTLGHDFDYICCAVGTGGTLAGLIKGLPDEIETLGFPVLKRVDYLKDEVEKWLNKEDGHTSASLSVTSPKHRHNWKLIHDYHFGGYAKMTPDLKAFINSVQSHTNLLLDRVYTGKLLFGVYDLVRKNYFLPGSCVLVLHAGGLQGGILTL